jgi:hypothetical protein
MRRFLLLLPLLVACAQAENAQTDTAAAAPMALTEADVAGTWMGTAMPMGSDSVVAQWTQVCANGACTGMIEGGMDTIRSTYTISGDSAMGTSAPYASPIAAGAMVTDSWIVRPHGDSVMGTGIVRLADMPDSVVLRYHFAGARGMMH